MRWYHLTGRSVTLLSGLMIFLVVVSVLPAQEGKSRESASQDSGRSEKTPPENPFTVPAGSAEELLAYIEKLQGQQPPEESREAVRDFEQKQQKAILEAAEKVMAEEPTDEQYERAAAEKVVALGRLARDNKKYKKQLQDFPQELAKAGHAELARHVKAFSLQRELRDVNREDFGKFVARVKSFLSEGRIDMAGVRLAINTARAVEGMGTQDQAAKAYRELGGVLAKSDDEQIADLGKTMEGTARRLDLVGNTMELEGVRMDGEPLDWSKYRDQVTLVMFWATWCGPCRQEIAEVKEVYKKYHDRGFDVVAISVDENREDVVEFIKQQDIPWTVVYDQARAGGKKGEPMSVRYGVMAIPQTVLVDRKGKVVATDLRGPQLEEQLKQMLGPAEEKNKEKE